MTDNTSQKVYDDSLTKIIKLVRGSLGDAYNQYYEGDPILIPKDNLPCVIFEKVKSNLKVGPTGFDVVSEQIQIRLVLNKNDDIGVSDDYDLTERRLRKAIEGRDPSTGFYSTDSLMYLLRTNLTLGNTNLDGDIDVEYDVNPRPNQQVTSEGIITIVTRQKVEIPNRI